MEKSCEVLHIVKFTIEHNVDNTGGEVYKGETGEVEVRRSRYMMAQTQLIDSKIAAITIEMFPIDHVFEVGIFDKSKIYKLDEDIFLMSLH